MKVKLSRARVLIGLFNSSLDKTKTLAQLTPSLPKDAINQRSTQNVSRAAKNALTLPGGALDAKTRAKSTLCRARFCRGPRLTLPEQISC